MVVMVDGDDDGNDDVAVVVKTKNLQQNDQIKQGITSSVTTTTTVHTENLQQNDQIKQRITSSVTITTTTTVQQYRTPPLAGGNQLQLPQPARPLPDPARKLQHWFTTSFFWRKVPESDARCGSGTDETVEAT